MALEKKVFVNMMIKEWIADTKYALSGREPKPHGIIPFCPVTVPQAVDYRLITAQQNQKEEYDSMFKDIDFILGKLRLDLILGYFSDKTQEPLIWRHGLCKPEEDYKSPETTSRLEGELKRFGADIYGKNPRDIKMTPELTHTYCLKNIILPLEKEIMEACLSLELKKVLPKEWIFERENFVLGISPYWQNYESEKVIIF